VYQELSPTEALDTAARFWKTGDFRAAAGIFGQMLQHPAMARWLVENGQVVPVSEALIETLFDAGEQEESLSAFSHFARMLDPTGDEWFDGAYLSGLGRTGTRPTPFGRRHRFHGLVQQLRATAGIAGEVVECGCFRGLSSYLICSTLRRERPDFDGHGYHVFDSFQGLSEPAAEDRIPADAPDRQRLEDMAKAGRFAAAIEVIKSVLAEFPGVAYHPGWIPQTFEGLPDRQYRFVHVDVDLYEPTRAAFEYFYPRLAVGGRIASDDYNWPGCRKAIEEFCLGRSIAFQVTPENQAYVVRPG
jgi:O-methyltransferase